MSQKLASHCTLIGQTLLLTEFASPHEVLIGPQIYLTVASIYGVLKPGRTKTDALQPGWHLSDQFIEFNGGEGVVNSHTQLRLLSGGRYDAWSC